MMAYMSTASGNHDRPQGEETAPSRDSQDARQDTSESGEEQQKVRLSSPNGLGVAADPQDADPSSMVQEPAKVMRIGTMVKQLLDEVRSAPLDEIARERLAEIHQRSVRELEDGLSEDLLEELHRITLPFTDDRTPSDAELRIAQAQLVGWLEGLFHGIQTALVAQQMAAQNQLVQMRRALPPGAQQGPGQQGPAQQMGMPGPRERGEHGTGQYL